MELEVPLAYKWEKHECDRVTRVQHDYINNIKGNIIRQPRKPKTG